MLSLLTGRKAYGVDRSAGKAGELDGVTKKYVLTPLEATLRAIIPGLSDDVPFTNFSVGVRSAVPR